VPESVIATRKVLAFSAGVEAVTGLALMALPALVGRLLFGGEITGLGLDVARCFGVALLALSFAVWPVSVATLQSVRAMLLYNGGLAVYLVWLGTAGHLAGPLLWPAAIIHGVVAALLARPLSLAGVQANR
jgi:hypothetical protein